MSKTLSKIFDQPGKLCGMFAAAGGAWMMAQGVSEGNPSLTTAGCLNIPAGMMLVAFADRSLQAGETDPQNRGFNPIRILFNPKKYPYEFSELLNPLINASLIWAGITSQSNQAWTITGISELFAAGILLIPQTSKAFECAAQGQAFYKKTWNFIQRHSLKIAGSIYMAGDVIPACEELRQSGKLGASMAALTLSFIASNLFLMRACKRKMTPIPLLRLKETQDCNVDMPGPLRA